MPLSIRFPSHFWPTEDWRRSSHLLSKAGASSARPGREALLRDESAVVSKPVETFPIARFPWLPSTQGRVQAESDRDPGTTIGQSPSQFFHRRVGARPRVQTRDPWLSPPAS